MSVTTSGDSVIRLHTLTMVPQDDGVMIGRPDTGSYALFPEEGARALRMLDSGVPVSGVATWYEQECGSSLDVEDFLATLEDLGFVLPEGQERPPAARIRWQRLARWVFSWPAWLCYIALMMAAIVTILREPALEPSYHLLFFTQYIALIPLTLTALQIPCILLHEGSHALAGRRLGLPSTMRLGRRLYYLVVETRLSALLSVPRRKRYLPFLAGMVTDAVVISVLTLMAAALRGHGIPSWCPALCLAVAFSCVFRLVWQFMLYLETDVYYVVATALRCSDLQNATRYYLRSQIRRALRRPSPPADDDWSDRDRAMARRYAPFLVAGYGFSIASLVWVGIPSAAHFWSLVIDQFKTSHDSIIGLADVSIFIGLVVLQFGLPIYVAVRDRRARTQRTSTQGALT
jgi:hypothetical protein